MSRCSYCARYEGKAGKGRSRCRVFVIHDGFIVESRFERPECNGEFECPAYKGKPRQKPEIPLPIETRKKTSKEIMYGLMDKVFHK